MLTESYLELKDDHPKFVVDQLSVFFDIDWNGPAGHALFDWIHLTAQHAFNRWKTSCHTLYKKQGRLPIPQNFVHRPNEWDFLCTLFETGPFKDNSKRMSETRLSKNRIEHISGPTLFRSRANKHVAAEHVAPHLATIAETTTSEDRKRLVEEEIQKLKNASGGTPESVGLPIRCPIEREISIIEQIVGPSIGTVVRGMGSLAVRPARMRGPTKGFSKPVSSEDERNLRQQLVEHDEEIRLLKVGQNEAKKEAAELKEEAAELKEEAAKQREMLESLMKMYSATNSNSNSNSTTSTSHALG